MKHILPLDQCIGITETADAALHIEEWEQNLIDIPAGILITKCPNHAFIDAVLRNQDKLIVHFTITGYAGTILEPNTPSVNNVLKYVYELIKSGFPGNQVVIRIDPIIPTQLGIERAEKVINAVTKLNKLLEPDVENIITRIRYSYIDMYKHVIEKFKSVGLKNPYEDNPYEGNKFTPQMYLVNNTLKMLDKYNKLYLFESCAEGDKYKRGCISNRDLEILGIHCKELEEDGFMSYVQLIGSAHEDLKVLEKAEPNYGIKLIGTASQRKTCLCPSNKVQLIKFQNVPCPNKCLYCYWK